MRLFRRYAYSLLVATSLVVAACTGAKQLGQTLGALAEVHSEIIKRFGERDVNVRVNSFQNKINIFVTFINSPLNDKSVEERTKRAQETAEIVKQHYRSIQTVNEIWVGFMRQTTRFAIFHWSEVFDVHGFDNEARSLDGSDVDPSKPTLRYSSSQNTTDISSDGIQLEGTPENGVSLVPHFSVAGNVNKVTPEPPKEVSLDFASFSETPRFPNVTKVVFVTDNNISYQTSGQFSTSKLADGTFSEFLYLKIPAQVFLKVTSGNNMRIRLGKQEYELTEIQLLQMQRMADYLKT